MKKFFPEDESYQDKDEQSFAYRDRGGWEKALKFTIVDLGRDYPGNISDFAEARNSFVKNLLYEEYESFVDSDEEAPKMLLDYIGRLKPQFPYYWVRRIELANNKYVPSSQPQL
jgi:hypothetical protein